MNVAYLNFTLETAEMGSEVQRLGATMAEIHHELKIMAPPERVFAALTTAQGLKAWHSAQVEGDGAPGHAWRFVLTRRPAFWWQVTEC
jgi:uncharacterized protein YndB with AHSA1/START domain